MLAQPNRIPSIGLSATAPPRQAASRTGSAWLASCLLAILALCGTGLLVGCTLPSDCGDLDYPTYGGAWQRTRRDSGRVGSVFDPAGARDATLAARDEPADSEDARSPADSIQSAPPKRRSAEDRGDEQAGPQDAPRPAPTQPSDRDRLRALDLEEIDLEPGAPAPPELN